MKFILLIVISSFAMPGGMASGYRIPALAMQEFLDEEACYAALTAFRNLASTVRLGKDDFAAVCVPAASSPKK